MRGREIVALVLASLGMGTYYASNWWEKSYATHINSVTSPDGCIRIDSYTPFWILPSMFHRMPHPDPSTVNPLGMQWSLAVFRRAYEVSTGKFLGETVVFDPEGPAKIIDWGNTSSTGRRVIVANEFPLADTDRCADKDTLARLEVFYEKEREENGKLQEIWRAQRELEEAKAAAERLPTDEDA